MWEIATLGNISTSTYFFACVAFSLERQGEGQGPSGAFLPRSPFALPNELEPLGTVRLLRLRLKMCIVKQENGQNSDCKWNFIPQLSYNPGQDG